MSELPGPPPLPPSFNPAPPQPGEFANHPGGPGGAGRPAGIYVQGPRPPVVHVVAKPGGFWRAVSIVGGLCLFALVFVIGLTAGLTFGIGMMVAGSSYSAVVEESYREGNASRVVIIPVIGEIDDRQAEFMHAAVKHTLEDDSAAAVVLRVDSPGGGVAASDEIWNEVNRLKNAGLPVIASYGGVAASGGYYVSCGADQIVAEETCITGSIGVIAQVLTLEGLMNKVGVQPVTLVASGSPEKDVANDAFRTWNEADKAKVRTMLDAAYATFNKRVRAGRQHVVTDPAKIDAVANGSIYTAQQALDFGLVDSIGYLDDAIRIAESSAGLPTGASSVVMLRQPPSLFGDGLFAQVRGSGSARQVTSWSADEIRSIVNDLASPRIMYRMH